MENHVLNTIFEGKERRTTKMNITFFVGNVVPDTVLKVFPQKIPCRLNENQKTGFGGTFSLLSMVLCGRLFPKTKGFTHWRTRTNHVNFMKIGLKQGRPEVSSLGLP